MIHWTFYTGNDIGARLYDALTLNYWPQAFLHPCWEFSLLIEETHETEAKKNSYLVHPLVASGHEDECQAQGQIVKREGDGREGEGPWSSWEQCLLASEF